MAETQQEKTTHDKAKTNDKRATRRFGLRLPVDVSTSENSARQMHAQTRDVSARGICFFIESAIAAGSGIEFTLTLPPEITLTEAIRVRCTGKVVRVGDEKEGKVAVAAVIDEYEFLAEP
jgi:PilZ domain-containing protein